MCCGHIALKGLNISKVISVTPKPVFNQSRFLILAELVRAFTLSDGTDTWKSISYITGKRVGFSTDELECATKFFKSAMGQAFLAKSDIGARRSVAISYLQIKEQ